MEERETGRKKIVHFRFFVPPPLLYKVYSVYNVLSSAPLEKDLLCDEPGEG